MAICGAPKWNKNHMVNTVLVAKEFYEFIDEWNKEKAKKGEYIWEMRLGIHAGPLVAGVVGKRKFSYDIWGDTVNTASRMESGGLPGKINISGFVYNRIKDQFACEYRGIITDKNGFEIQMYIIDPKVKTAD